MDPHERHPKPPYPPQHQERPGLEAALVPSPRYLAPSYRGSGKLRGKTALVTGGDSGIGRAVAVLFAREGADVAITHLPEEAGDAEETTRAVTAEGQRCHAIPADLTQERTCSAVVEATVESLGRLDVLVNNAALQVHVDRLEEITTKQWRRTFRTNVEAMFHLTKAALPHLEGGGAIVNSGSVTGLEGSKGAIDYAATNGAVHALTKSLAQNLLDRGIRVNCVAPGPVWTPLNPADRPAEEVAHFGEDTPMGRPGQPEEIAPAYVFLASETDSGFLTGEVLAVLGGGTRAG